MAGEDLIFRLAAKVNNPAGAAIGHCCCPIIISIEHSPAIFTDGFYHQGFDMAELLQSVNSVAAQVIIGNISYHRYDSFRISQAPANQPPPGGFQHGHFNSRI